jgi:hypothetical protein
MSRNLILPRAGHAEAAPAQNEDLLAFRLAKGANIKCLADYCGTSVAMIDNREVHPQSLRGAVNSDFMGEKSNRSSRTNAEVKTSSWACGEKRVWAHLDSNQGPTGYEPVALTN